MLAWPEIFSLETGDSRRFFGLYFNFNLILFYFLPDVTGKALENRYPFFFFFCGMWVTGDLPVSQCLPFELDLQWSSHKAWWFDTWTVCGWWSAKCTKMGNRSTEVSFSNLWNGTSDRVLFGSVLAKVITWFQNKQFLLQGREGRLFCKSRWNYSTLGLCSIFSSNRHNWRHHCCSFGYSVRSRTANAQICDFTRPFPPWHWLGFCSMCSSDQHYCCYNFSARCMVFASCKQKAKKMKISHHLRWIVVAGSPGRCFCRSRRACPRRSGSGRAARCAYAALCAPSGSPSSSQAAAAAPASGGCATCTAAGWSDCTLQVQCTESLQCEIYQNEHKRIKLPVTYHQTQRWFSFFPTSSDKCAC